MNKKVIIIIGIVIIAGAVFALKNFYDPSVETPTPTTDKLPAASSSVLDRIEAAIRAKLKR